MQPATPAMEVRLTGQLTQLIPLDDGVNPAAHGTHTPGLCANVPDGHGTHWSAPVTVGSNCVPRPHAVQPLEPVTIACVPKGHARHGPPVPVLYLPMGHLTHAAAPTSPPPSYPGGHTLHARAPPAGAYVSTGQAIQLGAPV